MQEGSEVNCFGIDQKLVGLAVQNLDSIVSQRPWTDSVTKKAEAQKNQLIISKNVSL